MKNRRMLMFGAILTVLLCLAGISTQAQYAYYITENATITITGYSGSGGNITLPSTATYNLPVTAIQDGAFANKKTITGVTIPDSISAIGSGAFKSCASLTAVKLGNEVSSIEDETFHYCGKLTGISLPDSVTSIGNSSFASCSNLASVSFGANLTSVGNSAFAYCTNLTTVTFPAKLTSLGDSAFAYGHLTQAYFQGNAPTVNGGDGRTNTTLFQGQSGTVYYAADTQGWGATFGGWPTSPLTSPATDFTYVTNNGTIAITGYVGAGGALNIPAAINGYPVTSLGDHAFNQPSITLVIIPPSVTSLGFATFASTKLTSVTIPASVLDIGGECFVCDVLTNIIVDPANPNFTSTGGVLFNKAMTWLLQCPGGYSGNYVVPNSVTCIADYAFVGCAGLNAVTLDPSLTWIGGLAFASCYSLTTVTIPASVHEMSGYTFYSCTNLSNVLFQGDCPLVNGGPGSVNTTVFLYDTSVVNYLYGGTGWGATFGGRPVVMLTSPDTDFSYTTNDGAVTITGYTGASHYVDIPATIAGYPVTAIGEGAFYGRTAIAGAILPDSVTSVGVRAFEYCSGMTNITLSNGLTNIGDYAISVCSALTNLTIPNLVNHIGVRAFESCSGLQSLSLGSDLTTIDDGAFSSCSSLTSVTLPDSLTSLGNWAFYCCYSLTNVTLGAGLQDLGSQEFQSCYSLGSLTIPAKVTSIGDLALVDCSHLTNVTVAAANPNYASMNGVLFNKSLTTLLIYPGGLTGSYTLPDSVTTIGNGAFKGSGLTRLILGRVSAIGDGALANSSLTNLVFLGNAPTSVVSTAFDGDGAVTVYYMPGTTGWTGWNSAFSNVTETQLPPPQMLGTAARPPATGLNFTLSWMLDFPVVVDASTNLQTWAPIATNTLVNGAYQFNDTPWHAGPRQFYRLHWP